MADKHLKMGDEAKAADLAKRLFAMPPKSRDQLTGRRTGGTKKDGNRGEKIGRRPSEGER
jgi:hypothetical protein